MTASTQRAEPTTRYTPDQTRAALLNAALGLFSRQGFHGTTVQQVVADANVTKGAFYHHFSSKNEILSEIHDVFIERHLRNQYRILTERVTATEQLGYLVIDLAQTIGEYQDHVRVYLQERHALSGSDSLEIVHKRDRVDALWYGVIKFGVETGEFTDVEDLRIATFGVLGMGSWMYQWFSREGDLTPDEIGRIFARMALRSLGATPPDFLDESDSALAAYGVGS